MIIWSMCYSIFEMDLKIKVIKFFLGTFCVKLNSLEILGKGENKLFSQETIVFV